MIGMKAEIQLFCTELLGATANSAYQGILLVLVVGIVLRFLVRTNAATRHAVWLATLILLILAIPAHYWVDRSGEWAGRSSAGHAAGPQVAAITGTAPAESIPPMAADPIWDFAIGAIEGGPGGLSQQPGTYSLELAEPSQPRPAEMITGLSAPPGLLSKAAGLIQQITERVVHPVSWNLEKWANRPLLVTVFALWLVITFFRLVMLRARWLQLRRFADECQRAEPHLQVLLARLQEESFSSRRAELRISERQRCPLVLGFVRPIILLPEDLVTEGSSNEVEQVIRHELAHVRRYDDWVNLFQHLAQAALFFHPAIWWVAKELSLEREIACDD